MLRCVLAVCMGVVYMQIKQSKSEIHFMKYHCCKKYSRKLNKDVDIMGDRDVQRQALHLQFIHPHNHVHKMYIVAYFPSVRC